MCVSLMSVTLRLSVFISSTVFFPYSEMSFSDWVLRQLSVTGIFTACHICCKYVPCVTFAF